MRVTHEEWNLPNFDINVLKIFLLIVKITACPTRKIGAHIPTF